ncbi:phosphoadenylyl-sulfate reductase [Paracraurococcus lichenis]|uniref:Adenosine 5'-phosphosulfate reductase n=1 Tax=Paracraurococcus lichenis TaxID=3064888 RepID=A0ABT9E9X8_9PROT|nr:phosphoadenylyl-sulfate reductase [Paracraurococcus sp. LOR1-02]MDO9712865.1 phosphoadenylyl-sulfate reductase [Paracraurococcus sp. LOR1-02]
MSPLHATASALVAELAELTPATAIALLADRFRGRIALVSSFGAEAAVLLHLVARADPSLPVLFLDTGKLFPETLAYRDRLVRRFGLRDVRSLRPDPAAIAARDPIGGLFAADPDACCALRKVAPLGAALAAFDVWLNGRKRAHGAGREALPLVEAVDGRLKVNPLLDWDAATLAAYARTYDLPPHPLTEQGYASIGCIPCTSPVTAGEASRAGRWRGSGKSECGIHDRPLTSPHARTD